MSQQKENFDRWKPVAIFLFGNGINVILPFYLWLQFFFFALSLSYLAVWFFLNRRILQSKWGYFLQFLVIVTVCIFTYFHYMSHQKNELINKGYLVPDDKPTPSIVGEVCGDSANSKMNVILGSNVLQIPKVGTSTILKMGDDAIISVLLSKNGAMFSMDLYSQETNEGNLPIITVNIQNNKPWSSPVVPINNFLGEDRGHRLLVRNKNNDEILNIDYINDTTFKITKGSFLSKDGLLSVMIENDKLLINGSEWGANCGSKFSVSKEDGVTLQ